MGIGGSNMSNGTGFADGFPSLQSGSWSALMKSAVAETSSNDVGLHEERSGLSYQNTEVPARNLQPSANEDTTKQQTMWNSGSTPLPNDANFNNGYQGFTGLQQSGQRFSYEHSERPQRNSSHRSIQQSSEEGSKWLSHNPLKKPLTEGIQIYGNAVNSLDTEMNAKSVSGSWPNQQKVSSLNSGQQQNKPNGHNVGEAITASRDALSVHHRNENDLHHLQGHRGGHLWKADSGLDSSIGLERAMFSREDSSLNNLAATPYSSSARSSQETTQFFPNSHHFSNWKHTDSSLKSKATADSGKFQHHHNKGPQVLESIETSAEDPVKVHGTEKCDRIENSSDSRGSNLCQHTTTGDIREGNWSDGVESQNFPEGKEKSSGHSGRRTRGIELASHSQAMSQQDIQRNKNGVDDTPSRRTFPGFAPNTSAPFDRSVSIREPKKAAQSSQNMLELLHNVDESQEHGNSDESVGPLRQNQYSCQGFSLQHEFVRDGDETVAELMDLGKQLIGRYDIY
ncbi:hypothetical protein Vadar_021063 [Vaccinium darrowii]|uniref:Uncharacterized protein n=1 Tax=Vaccinium darrowii TaxID=229202 RepID=A0ACB7YNH7_9ERIC|nr:hypothetical protein Vadar_021063 [Vaccinium darrowii]